MGWDSMSREGAGKADGAAWNRGRVWNTSVLQAHIGRTMRWIEWSTKPPDIQLVSTLFQ